MHDLHQGQVPGQQQGAAGAAQADDCAHSGHTFGSHTLDVSLAGSLLHKAVLTSYTLMLEYLVFFNMLGANAVVQSFVLEKTRTD